MNHRVLTGHRGAVLTVAFSPDGKKLASISYDKTLRLWNVETGDCICVFDTLVVPTASCKLFFGTNTVALINSLNNVLLWNLRTRERVQPQLPGFFCGVFCHDHTLFASAGYEPTVRIYNVKTGQLEQEILADHRDLFCSIAFSHSKKLLAAGSRDRTIWLWNFDTEACEKRFVGHDGSVIHVAFSPDDKIMASSAGGTNMLIWSVNSGQCIFILPLNFHMSLHTAFHRSSKLVASVGDFDSRILVWNVETGVCVLNFDGGLPCGVVFQPNGKTLASGGYDSAVRLWRLLDYDALCGALQLFFVGAAPYVLLDVANMCCTKVQRFDAASTFLRFEKICFIEGAIERCKKNVSCAALKN